MVETPDKLRSLFLPRHFRRGIHHKWSGGRRGEDKANKGEQDLAIWKVRDQFRDTKFNTPELHVHTRM